MSYNFTEDFDQVFSKINGYKKEERESQLLEFEFKSFEDQKIS